jgi:imidazolonepropionase-like amidohydrolase
MRHDSSEDGARRGLAPKTGVTISRRDFLAGTAALTAATAFPGCASRPATVGTTAVPRFPGVAGPLLLTNARLLDVEAGTVSAVAGVFLKDGRVAEIFRDAVPGGIVAPREDLRGDVLVPGLIDAHVHATMPHIYELGTAMTHIVEATERNLAAFVENGVTTVRDMGGAARLLARRLAAVARGERVGPRVVRCDAFVQTPRGYPCSMRPMPWPLSTILGDMMIWARTPAEGREIVQKLRGDGAQVVKLALDSKPITLNQDPIPVLADAILEAIRQEASRQGMPVAAHHTHLDAGRLAIAHRADTLEHLPVDGVYGDADLRAIEAAKAAFVPTLSVGVNLAFDAPDPIADPLVREAVDGKTEFFRRHADRFMVPAGQASTARILAKYLDGRFSKRERREVALWNGRMFAETIRARITGENLARLRQAGAVIGCGSDAGTPFAYAGNLALELHLLVTIGGLTPAEALRAATIDNARLLGLADHLGSIAPGKLADLVVLGKDPLADVRNVRAVRAVYQAGARTVTRTEESWIA